MQTQVFFSRAFFPNNTTSFILQNRMMQITATISDCLSTQLNLRTRLHIRLHTRLLLNQLSETSSPRDQLVQPWLHLNIQIPYPISTRARGQIMSNIAEVVPKIFPWIHL